MQVLELMNTNENWRAVLTNEPYNIIIKEDGDYVLLKYNQLNSDFTNPIVRECRGSIFRKEGNDWTCVCRAFDKFGNYGEGYVPQIDWETATVQEKVDGSLMKLWYDRSAWHLSTNGTIDAFAARLGDFNMTFGDYFVECLAISFEDFVSMLDQNYCYMFEMVGPKNRVVIDYDKPMLFALAQRNMKTMQETVYSGPADEWVNVYLPKHYSLNSLDEVISAAKRMSKDEEGFVVRDANFNRVKVKSPEYLIAARLMNNGAITRKRMLEIFLEDKQDDFLSYCPSYKDAFNEVVADFMALWLDVIRDTEEIRDNKEKYFSMTRKEYAECVAERKYKDFLFKYRDLKERAVIDYLKGLSIDKLLVMMDKIKGEKYED